MLVVEFRKENPWFDRMIKEKDELTVKINDLKNALDNTEFMKSLSIEHGLALTAQFNAMASYLMMLTMREKIIIRENNLKDK